MAIDLSQFITATALNVSSISAVFSSAVSSGSLVVAHVGIFNNLGGGKFSTITDNINNAGFTRGCFSTMSNAGDTSASAGIFFKLNISSGAGASTYRVSMNSSAGINSNHSLCAMEYTGGAFVLGSTGSSNGTSTGPRGPALTASSTPQLFVTNATHNSTVHFDSTVGVAGGTWRVTVDDTNANQILAVGDSTFSSLTQQPTFSMVTSTRWLANVLVFTGLGSGGAAAATKRLWRMAVMGVN